MSTTKFENKCEILGELWMVHRKDPEFQDFIEYNDLGLPIAYAISEGMVSKTPIAQQYIDETFDMLLVGLDIDDTGFESLDQIIGLEP
jgi:hypothetical protein